MLFVVTAVFHSAATEIIVQVVFTFTTDSFQHREDEKEIKKTFCTENRNDSLAFNGLSGWVRYYLTDSLNDYIITFCGKQLSFPSNIIGLDATYEFINFEFVFYLTQYLI